MQLCVSDWGVDWHMIVVVLDHQNFTSVKLCSRNILPCHKSRKQYESVLIGIFPVLSFFWYINSGSAASFLELFFFFFFFFFWVGWLGSPGQTGPLPGLCSAIVNVGL